MSGQRRPLLRLLALLLLVMATLAFTLCAAEEAAAASVSDPEPASSAYTANAEANEASSSAASGGAAGGAAAAASEAARSSAQSTPGSCAAGDSSCAGASANGCPVLVQPKDVHFFVINMYKSVNRLQRMKDQFKKFDYPMFTRVEGVEWNETTQDKLLPLSIKPDGIISAFYAYSVSHYNTWHAIRNSTHKWAIVLEDDALLVNTVDLLKDLPKVPRGTDMVILHSNVVTDRSPLNCPDTPIQRVHNATGLVAYLIHRSGAQRLIDKAKDGFVDVVEQHVLLQGHAVYTVTRNFVDHPPCKNLPCKNSLRNFYAGFVKKRPD